MKILDYKKLCEENYYQIDWDRNETHYVEPLNGVQVYQHGEVTIHRDGYRDPDWRRRFFDLTGLSANVLSEDFPGRKFFSPSGEPVKKNSIDAETLIYDPERRVAYKIAGWGHHLSFFRPDEIGTSTSFVPVIVPQPKRKAEEMAKLKEYIELGTTLATLETVIHRYHGISTATQKIIESGSYPKDLTKDAAQAFCLNLVTAKSSVESYILKATSNTHQYPYLIVD
jgi:hypothetical protein